MSSLLRLNPGVDVVPWVALLDAERDAVNRITGQEAVPGIVRSKVGHLATVKAIDQSAMTLLESLREPQVVASAPAVMPRHVKRLVLEGLIEVEVDGTFVSGPNAATALGEVSGHGTRRDRIAELSHEALRYAETLPITEARVLSARLYGYNTLPRGPKWVRAFGDSTSIAEWLGLGERGANALALADQGFDGVEHEQWLAWTRRAPGGAPKLPESGFKLYVSPHPDDLPEVLARLSPLLEAAQVSSIKVGRTLQNVLRPDKCVLYFDDAGDLQRLGRGLAKTLAGCAAQGVPFTCGFDESPDALLSWGADPPRSLCLAGWAQADSWRAWIANRLAVALLQGKSEPSAALEPWRFAVTKLALERIDTERWAPAADCWVEE